MLIPRNGSAPKGRSTRPPGFNPNPGGGISIIPRRGWTVDGANDYPFGGREALLKFAARNPWLLSEALADADPTMGKAQSNTLAACAAPGTVKLVAWKDNPDEPGTQTRDDEATAEIETVLNRLGPEVGGLDGFRTKGTMEVLHSGFWGFEPILGPRLYGLKGVGFVDSNSIDFDRDDEGYLRIYQKQQGAPNGRRELDQSRFFWYAHHASVKNPYGRGVFVAAVVETLKAQAFDQDLSDATHNIAFARYVYKYSRAALWRIAVTPVEQGGLGLSVSVTDIDGKVAYPAREFVDNEMSGIGVYLSEKNVDDNFVVDGTDGGGVETLESGDFTGIEPVVSHKDFRQIRALDELATTIGRPNSGAQTYTTAEFGLKALGWEAIRANVIAPILSLLNYHFAARGKQIVVKAEFEPIRRSDAVQEANAEKLREAVAWQKYLHGSITFEDYCLMTSGSGAPKNETPEQIAEREEARKREKSSRTSSTVNDLPQEGTTTEERDAAKSGTGE